MVGVPRAPPLVFGNTWPSLIKTLTAWNQTTDSIDDLSVLEKINLLIIGLASINPKISVPSDIPAHNQFIPSEHLKSQEYLNNIKDWTDNQKMILNEKKTKVMIFNFTDNYKFTAKLSLNQSNLELVQKTKLLGVIMTDDLKWSENTKELVKKAYSRMELLRKVASFKPPIDDLKNIYMLYVRSILEQSCVVWHSTLTKENANDLERVQKCAIRIMLGEKYSEYESALLKVDLDDLKTRRENLCLNFAKKCLESDKTQELFPLNENNHVMKGRNTEKYQVNFANTDRLKNSSLPYMQRLLNSDVKKIKEDLVSTRRLRKPG